jgi:hypothetical protein
MKLRLCGLAYRTAVCVFLLTMSCQLASAGFFTMSWSGTVKLEGANDPWGIGSSPVPFDIDVDVPLSAPDLSPTDAAIAAFDIVSARLVIAGRQASFAGGGVISFYEGDLLPFGGGGGFPDFVVLQADFTLAGSQETFFSAFLVPTETFSLTQLVESPPDVKSAVVIAEPESFVFPYRSSVPVGTQVTVVPEPAAFSSSLVLLLTRVRARRRRVMAAPTL